MSSRITNLGGTTPPLPAGVDVPSLCKRVQQDIDQVVEGLRMLQSDPQLVQDEESIKKMHAVFSSLAQSVHLSVVRG